MNPIRGYTDGLAASYAAATFLTPLAPRDMAPRRRVSAKRTPDQAARKGTVRRFLTRITAGKVATGLAACLALAVLI